MVEGNFLAHAQFEFDNFYNCLQALHTPISMITNTNYVTRKPYLVCNLFRDISGVNYFWNKDEFSLAELLKYAVTYLYRCAKADLLRRC